MTSDHTLGATQSVNAWSCHHGTVWLIGEASCGRCKDEDWAAWFEGFMDRWEEKHGHRYPLHGFDEADLREAYEA